MNELVYILEAAKEHCILQNMWWRSFKETGDQRDYYLYREEYGCVVGLLKAYEIISGKHIPCWNFAIDEELAKIA